MGTPPKPPSTPTAPEPLKPEPLKGYPGTRDDPAAQGRERADQKSRGPVTWIRLLDP